MDDWIKYYDELAKVEKDYISQAGYKVEDHPIDEEIFDRWAQLIQQKFEIESSHFLIDVGCGSGIFLKRFRKFTENLFGVDTSEHQIRNAKINCPVAKLRVGSALDAAFGNIYFDRIFCNSVFLYFESLEYAKKVTEYFVSISTNRAKIFIGDLPIPTANMKDGNYRRKGKAMGFEVQHYPFEFFESICRDLNLECYKIEQKVEGKPTSKWRYDLLIKK